MNFKSNYSERKERRKRTRVVAECMAVEGTHTPRHHFLAYTRDISLSGAHLVVDASVSPGERLMVSFEIPTYFLPISVCAEVIWTNDVAQPVEPVKFIREAGVRFLESDRLTQQKLYMFTESSLYQEAYELVS